MRFAFIKKNEEKHDVGELRECLEVSRSGYYAWTGRGPSERARADASHKKRIGELHARSRGRYGHRQIHDHLREEGVSCGRDRVLKIMKELGVAGCSPKRFKPAATDSSHDFGYAPNLLREMGNPAARDQVWVADTTYLRTEGGWCYFATVMDLFSRRLIGWSVSERNDSKLACEALKAAILTLKVMVLPEATLPLAIYTLEDPKSPLTQFEPGEVPAAEDFVEVANDVFKQAGVSFELHPSSGSKEFGYDTLYIKESYSRYSYSDGEGREPDGIVSYGEYEAIRESKTAEKIFPNVELGKVGYFLIRKLNGISYFDDKLGVDSGPPYARGGSGGILAMDHLVSKEFALLAVAHEIGHNLGLSTVDDGGDDDDGHDFPPYPEQVTLDDPNGEAPRKPGMVYWGREHEEHPERAFMASGKPERLKGKLPWLWGRWMRREDWIRSNGNANNRLRQAEQQGGAGK